MLLTKYCSETQAVSEFKMILQESAYETYKCTVYQCAEYCAQLDTFEVSEPEESKGKNYSDKAASAVVNGLDPGYVPPVLI